jgi:hypothetical protein
LRAFEGTDVGVAGPAGELFIVLLGDVPELVVVGKFVVFPTE